MAYDFTVSNFSGSVPRIAPHLLQPGHAVIARDCKLSHGTLASWREPALYRQAAPGTVTTYEFGKCWLDFDSCVDVAYGPVNCQRLFVTGVEDWPAVLTVDDSCNVKTRRLGVPCPPYAPFVVPGDDEGTHEKDLVGRSYAYQYANAEGERSALSPGSLVEFVRDGQPVVVSGWNAPDPSWGVEFVYIFRTVTGHQSGYEDANVPDTVWMEVGGVPVENSSFTDTLFSEELAVALTDDSAVPIPPANLQGITWIESMNCLSGFVGNRIYFSDNGKYHSWPHYLDLDDNVKAIIEVNGLLYALTDGRPYVIDAAVDCVTAACRTAVKLSTAYPLVGTGTRRAARTRAGVVYPTHNGLVLLSGRAGPTLITWPYYSDEDWQKLEPHTVTPVEYGGKLFVFAAGGSFVLTTADNPETGWANDAHSTLSDTDVLDALVTRNGHLMLLKADRGVYAWDRGAELRPHLWVSNEFVTTTPVHQGGANVGIDFDKEHLRITADGRVVLDREVLSSRVMRLPMWATGQRWQITLSGTAVVKMFSVAPSMHDLRS